MKKSYITDKEVDELTVAIYNDVTKDYYKSIPEDDLDYNEELVEELFKEVEYQRVDISPEYIITKQGRVFNSRTIRYIKPILSTTSISSMIRQKRIPLEQFFEDNGWTYDQEEIVKTYKKNKWGIIVIDSAKSYFRSLR